jgi:hypothetical protein
MANPFQTFVQRLIDLGFYDFVFPFIITSALLYALLRKTKIFGESVAVNAVVALSIGFMIFGFPVLAGLTLATNWSIFFTQATVFLLIFFVALLLSSLFYPDLMKMLAEQFTRRTTLYQMIALAVTLLVTSGLVVVFTNSKAWKRRWCRTAGRCCINDCNDNYIYSAYRVGYYRVRNRTRWRLKNGIAIRNSYFALAGPGSFSVLATVHADCCNFLRLAQKVATFRQT